MRTCSSRAMRRRSFTARCCRWMGGWSLERKHATIVATASYLPEREITNDMLRARFREHAPEFVDKMEAASGIRSRWAAPDDWATSDLALRAAQAALQRANKAPEE